MDIDKVIAENEARQEKIYFDPSKMHTENASLIDFLKKLKCKCEVKKQWHCGRT